jgi:hypothetical protein
VHSATWHFLGLPHLHHLPSTCHALHLLLQPWPESRPSRPGPVTFLQRHIFTWLTYQEGRKRTRPGRTAHTSGALHPLVRKEVSSSGSLAPGQLLCCQCGHCHLGCTACWLRSEEREEGRGQVGSSPLPTPETGPGRMSQTPPFVLRAHCQLWVSLCIQPGDPGKTDDKVTRRLETQVLHPLFGSSPGRSKHLSRIHGCAVRDTAMPHADCPLPTWKPVLLVAF